MKTILQWCPTCRVLVRAPLTYEYRDHMLVGDRSVCPDCARVLWDWTYTRGRDHASRSRPTQLGLFE